MDVFLFVHFFFEYILLRMIGKMMTMKGGTFRSFAGAFFAGGCNVILTFVSVPELIKFVLIYFMIVFVELWIAFPDQNIYTYAKAFGFMYLLSFGMGGFLKWTYEKFEWADKYGRSILWLFGGIYFLSLFMGKICMFVKRERQEKEKLRMVLCEVNGEKISCVGLWDTGNSLYDPLSKKPVLVLEKSELVKHSIHIKKEQYRIIPYHSLGTKQGVLEAFVADKVVVTSLVEEKRADGMEREKVIIGIYEGKLSQDGCYQMILHPEM